MTIIQTNNGAKTFLVQLTYTLVFNCCHQPIDTEHERYKKILFLNVVYPIIFNNCNWLAETKLTVALKIDSRVICFGLELETTDLVKLLKVMMPMCDKASIMQATIGLLFLSYRSTATLVNKIQHTYLIEPHYNHF